MTQYNSSVQLIYANKNLNKRKTQYFGMNVQDRIAKERSELGLSPATMSLDKPLP
jgi:hypothetical protein